MCSGELKAVLGTLRRLARAKLWTEVVTLLIPTINDSEAEVRSLARFVRDEVGRETPLHFTRFHPTYRLTNLPPTPVATLEKAREIALAEGLPFAYLGNVPGHPGESTYCPGCKARLIHRVGMATVENRLMKGACPDCGRAIPGVWS
jgi:pyruvate formate lyase activating enzyme